MLNMGGHYMHRIGYLVSGVTVAAGAVSAEQEAVLPTVLFNMGMDEIALLVGILGTIATVLFQYLNYKNNRRPPGPRGS